MTGGERTATGLVIRLDATDAAAMIEEIRAAAAGLPAELRARDFDVFSVQAESHELSSNDGSIKAIGEHAEGVVKTPTALFRGGAYERRRDD